ncbi:MAG: DUF5132 domain-containing protein [Acetobacteraceae bacterium]|nr:DUF5132 domain-containing protein [Acetobacteraceae bacterium]
MAFFDDMFKGGNLVTGLAIAVGTAVLVPVIGPVVGSVLRPAAKAVIKGGIVAYDWGRQAVAEASESASDMVAEVRSDAQSGETGSEHRPHPAEPQPA